MCFLHKCSRTKFEIALQKFKICHRDARSKIQYQIMRTQGRLAWFGGSFHSTFREECWVGSWIKYLKISWIKSDLELCRSHKTTKKNSKKWPTQGLVTNARRILRNGTPRSFFWVGGSRAPPSSLILLGPSVVVAVVVF